MAAAKTVVHKDGSVWVPVKRLCEKFRVDYARKREALLATTIPRKKIKVRSHDGKAYQMWCIPETAIGRFKNEVVPYRRGPYNKEERW